MTLKNRIFSCLTLLFLLLQSVQSEEPLVSLSVRNLPVEQVLLQIEKQTGLRVSFESSLLKNIPSVTMSVKHQSLSMCLYELLYKYEIEWLITGDYLILKRKGEERFSVEDSLKLVSLQEVLVEADSLRSSAALSDEPGKEILSGNRIQKIPAVLSQPDLIKGIQQLPGVAMGTEGLSGMYVRGGNNDENLFLIDAMPVYQVSHVGGLFSAFNPDVVDKFSFYKGFFPAKYDGRLSSVTDIHTKEGNREHLHGGFGVGLIQGNVYLEGPLIKNKLSFHAAMRRSWADLITAPAFAIINKSLNGDYLNCRYSFHDVNGRMDYRYSDRSRWTLSIYSGDDLFRARSKNEDYKVYTDNKYKIRWGNLASALTWNYRVNDHLKSKFVASYTRYRSKLFFSTADNESSDYLESETVSGIDDGRLSWSFVYKSSFRHHIQGGVSARLQAFRPEYMEFVEGKLSSDDIAVIQLREQNKLRMLGNETVLFISDRMRPLKHLTIDAGFSLATFYLKHTFYANLSPRLSVRYTWNPYWSAKLAYSRMSQPVHLIPSTYLDLPTDIWLPSTDKVKPSVSDQVSGGIHYAPNTDYSFSLEGYYKYTQHLMDFKPWVGRFPDAMPWEDKLADGTGRAYGAEVTLRKETGKLTGWVGYTLAWADRQFAAINNGKRFPSRYDNRHKVNVVASYTLSKKVELNASWVYSKGNWMTLAQSTSNYVEKVYKNNYQLPNYHRLDLGVNIYKKTKKGRTAIWNISIYNVYNRKNIMMAWPNKYDSETKRVQVKQICAFPIIPSFSYTYKF